MKRTKVLRGITGFLMALAPILGWGIIGILLLARNKSKYLIIPLLCSLFFILVLTVDNENQSQRKNLETSLLYSV